MLMWEARELEEANDELTEAQKEIELKNKDLLNKVDELNEANRKISETKSQMIQSEKMAAIGILSSGVAHEINNPTSYVGSNLNTIQKYAKSLSDFFIKHNDVIKELHDKNNAPPTDVLDKIYGLIKSYDIEYITNDMAEIIKESKEGIVRIRDIVKELKEFSHVDQGSKQEFDVNDCLEGVIKLTHNEIKYKARLEKDFGDLPYTFGRSRQLSQVFLNTIVNASQAIEDQGKISIKTFTTGTHIVIIISDNGCGMSEETKNKLFNPFFTTKPVGTGTGLGLYISYGIINEHGGTIEVDSTLGVGTSFTFKLPIDLDRESLLENKFDTGQSGDSQDNIEHTMKSADNF